MSVPLKNCPFCDGIATFSEGRIGIPTIPGHYIECLECAASSCMLETSEQALCAWNTRHVEQGEIQLPEKTYDAIIENYKKLLAFVKKVNDGFCLNQTDEQGLQMLVDYENEAEALLKEIGEAV